MRFSNKSKAVFDKGKAETNKWEKFVKECLENKAGVSNIHFPKTYLSGEVGFRYKGFNLIVGINVSPSGSYVYVTFRVLDTREHIPVSRHGSVTMHELMKKINNFLEDVDNYFTRKELLLDVKREYKDIIEEVNDTNVLVNYNNIPMFIGMKPKIWFSKGLIVSSNGEDTKLYIDSLNEVPGALKSIETELLYDLSNFTDAFRSMMNIVINGYSVDITSFVIDDEYSMKFRYTNEINTIYFKIKPFRKIIEYSKNNLEPIVDVFRNYEHVLFFIKDILEQSKTMLPFDVEEQPSMVYNNLTGRLEEEEEEAKQLPYKEE